MQEQLSASERLKALTDQLEQGVSDIFQSGQYAAYLTAMSKFHHYSFGNAMLIFMQSPKLLILQVITIGKENLADRSSRGEHGITILAPVLTADGRKWRKRPRTALRLRPSNGCSA